MAKQKLVIFADKDRRRDYYPMLLSLMEKGCEIEAAILILATWNSSRFRFVMNDFDLYEFKKKIDSLASSFNKMQYEDFKTIDFVKYGNEIKRIFKVLSGIAGIESTGASKLMHLKLPQVFVMWDKRIREDYGYMAGDAEDYRAFLNDMQKRFSGIKIKSDRTFAKLVDENNYLKITVPALRKAKNKKANRKKNSR